MDNRSPGSNPGDLVDTRTTTTAQMWMTMLRSQDLPRFQLVKSSPDIISADSQLRIEWIDR
jgi:hypothetical protein